MAGRPVRIVLHAQAADVVACRSLDVELPADATVAAAKRALAARFPRLEPLLAVSALATDDEYLRDDAPLGEAAALHLVPPVSGG